MTCGQWKRSAIPNPDGQGRRKLNQRSYGAVGGVRGALTEAWTFTREETLPRLDPQNYTAEFEGWSNVNISFRGGNFTRALSDMITARELRVAVPLETTAEQLKQIKTAIEYGRSRGVTVRITEIEP